LRQSTQFSFSKLNDPPPNEAGERWKNSAKKSPEVIKRRQVGIIDLKIQSLKNFKSLDGLKSRDDRG
jgi:hypothetical protein